jgi:predicted RNA-binding Zn-ribbon protein involved in translation (DUF1610 family)
MKILEKGKVPGTKSAQFKCRNCGSRLEATRDEGRLSTDQRDGDARVFDCPICKAEIWVNASNFK